MRSLKWILRMPTYEYKCTSCEKIESHRHKMNENPSFSCINCFGKGLPSEMKKGFGGGLGVHFKGSGFYETDYKRK